MKQQWEVMQTVYTGGDHTGSGVWNPMTLVVPSTGLVAVQVSVEVPDGSGLEVRPGVQVGKVPVLYGDTLLWSSPVSSSSAGFQSPSGWYDWDGWLTITGDFGADELPYLRVGLFVRNVSGALEDEVLSAQVRLVVRVKPVVHGAAGGGPRVVPTGGGSAWLFTALTGALPQAPMGSVRVSWEQDAEATGNVSTIPGCQVSQDGVTWEDPPTALATLLGVSARTSNGLTAGTAFVALDDGGSPATELRELYRYIRFGAASKNVDDSGNPEMCRVTIRVEWRG